MAKIIHITHIRVGRKEIQERRDELNNCKHCPKPGIRHKTGIKFDIRPILSNIKQVTGYPIGWNCHKLFIEVFESSESGFIYGSIFKFQFGSESCPHDKVPQH